MIAATSHQAADYAARGWAVFPCHWHGDRRKQPLTDHGLRDATTDLALLDAWWSRWPDALIGAPTGVNMGAVVLDVDVKRLDANGKQIYSQIVESKDKATADRFRDLILDLVRRQSPGDLEGDVS